MGFTVLMTVYNKENPLYFEIALDSVLTQTLIPSEIVVVKDGRLTQELDKVLEKFVRRYPKLFSILSFDNHIGRGEALKRGVEYSRFEVVAIMDSDDISNANRFQKQINFLEENDDIDIVGSFIEEFEGTEDNIAGIREVPLSHQDIATFAKRRNPINHVTMMFRKGSILKAGNYQNLLGFEDYYLMVRAIKVGAKFANIPECLVKVRISNDMFKRRGGFKYLISELKVQKKFLAIGFIGYFDFLSNIVLKGIIRITPNFVRKQIYQIFLRKNYRVG